MKLAKAYKMLQTCYIKHGPLEEPDEFTAGKTYARSDIPPARLPVWIQQGFCVPAGPGSEVEAVADPEERPEPKRKRNQRRPLRPQPKRLIKPPRPLKS